MVYLFEVFIEAAETQIVAQKDETTENIITGIFPFNYIDLNVFAQAFGLSLLVYINHSQHVTVYGNNLIILFTEIIKNNFLWADTLRKQINVH